MELFLAENPFISIQGEGNTTNTLSYFIRFFGCNLSCSFCDSKYSWENKTTRIKISVDEIVSGIMSSNIRNVIFTGGEPTLYQDKILEVISQLKKQNYLGTFEIETNGMVQLNRDFIHYLFNNQIKIQFNISPKIMKYIKHSSELGEFDYFETVIKFNLDFLHFNGIKFILKFVDEEEARPNIISALQRWGIYDINNMYKNGIEIFIMPECQTREEHLNKAGDTLNFCKENGFKFCPRLHILLWDSKKGV